MNRYCLFSVIVVLVGFQSGKARAEGETGAVRETAADSAK